MRQLHDRQNQGDGREQGDRGPGRSHVACREWRFGRSPGDGQGSHRWDRTDEDNSGKEKVERCEKHTDCAENQGRMPAPTETQDANGSQGAKAGDGSRLSWE